MPDRATVRVVPIKLAIARFHEDPFPPLAREGTRRVYPYPMQDDLSDEMVEREFQAVVLENGLLRCTVLPELGGHVLSLRDLVHDRDVFYRNEPLKLGLIAMRGAWWAGGIEFNFPQVGHAVSTTDRVSWHIREEADGAATAFVGGIEHLTRMAWSVALTLRPDDWRLHVRVRLANRTPFAHRIYFWSNSAVPARDDFRLLLPATRVYSWWYGAEGDATFPLCKGQDLSRYTTYSRAADAFAKDLRANWFGGYYDELDCGVLHLASRFDVPGRKMFTWGRADDGLMWAELLNAEGRPYVEIQAGRFVHQGVHRLLAPGGVESWEEAWAPVWGLGGVVHATKSLALNATREGGEVVLRLLALAAMPEVRVAVQQGERTLESACFALAAGEARALRVPLDTNEPLVVELNGEKVTLRLEDGAVRPALDGAPPHTAVPDVRIEGEPSTPQGWLLKARDHEERSELDAAADCFRKALQLDPACAPAMADLAQWHLRRGELGAAKDWANKALRADLQSEDALWWLAVATFLEGGEPLAQVSALRRSPRYASNAFALLGEMALRRGDADAALEFLDAASERNGNDLGIVALAALAERRAGADDNARALLNECEKDNPFEPLLWSEAHFLAGGSEARVEAAIGGVLGSDPQAYLEVTCDYERVGAWESAAAWLRDVAVRRADPARQAMLLYHEAMALWRLGRVSAAMGAAGEAAKQSPLFVFPHRHEDAEALRTALRLSPDDALAHLLLGTWLASAGRWDEAMEHWTRTTQLCTNTELAVLAWRNISLMRWHKQHDAPAALAAYSAAIAALSGLPSSPPTPNTEHLTPLLLSSWRLWLERDTILAAGERHDERLAAIESAPDDVKANPQIIARWAEASLRAGRLEQAVDILSRCSFKPWEGEQRARKLWKEAHMQCGHRAKDAGDLAKAREHFESAASYPRHLNIGKPALTDDADALFWAGWCASQAGDSGSARRLLAAAATESQPREATSTDFKRRAADLLRQLA